MSRQICYLFLVLMSILSGCGIQPPSAEVPAVPPAESDMPQTSAPTEHEPPAASDAVEITMTFGDTVVTAEMTDSETTRAFLDRLPLTLDMNRYADREYYAAISELPEDGEAIPDFENGDVTYYTTGRSLAIFFGNADNSSQGGLIRMGRITSDLSQFDSLGDSETVVIAFAEDDPTVQAEQAVKDAYQSRCDAMVNMDIEALDEMMADDLLLQHITGAVQTKEEWLACIENEEMRYFDIDIESLSVEVQGNTATVQHTATLDARIYGGRGSWTLSGTSYYEKRDGKWIWVNPPET